MNQRIAQALTKPFEIQKTQEFIQTLKKREKLKSEHPDSLKKIEWALLKTEKFETIEKSILQAEYLFPKYHVVIANPPYMGGKGMNGRLAAWVKDNYPNSKSDLFAMFIERNLDLAQKRGEVGMVTMQSWMFLSSFERLRTKILDEATILSMAHLGPRAFDSIGGEVVSTTAFVLANEYNPEHKGAYIRLVDGNSEAEKMAMLAKAIAQGSAAS